MKKKKYEIPVHESYQSNLSIKKRRILNGISDLSALISLISSIRLCLINDKAFNLTPQAITLDICQMIMFISLILSVHMDWKKKETVSYAELMHSHGILLIASLASALFGLAAFQKHPVSMPLLWIIVCASFITGVMNGIIYSSYRKG